MAYLAVIQKAVRKVVQNVAVQMLDVMIAVAATAPAVKFMEAEEFAVARPNCPTKRSIDSQVKIYAATSQGRKDNEENSFYDFRVGDRYS